MNKKLLLAGIATFAVVLGTAVVAPALAYGHKIAVCHYDPENNTYTLIKVGSDNAKEKHLENHQYENGADFLPDEEHPCPPLD
jgi:hypothetical protein